MPRNMARARLAVCCMPTTLPPTHPPQVDHPWFLAKVWGMTGSKLYGAKSGSDYGAQLQWGTALPSAAPRCVPWAAYALRRDHSCAAGGFVIASGRFRPPTLSRPVQVLLGRVVATPVAHLLPAVDNQKRFALFCRAAIESIKALPFMPGEDCMIVCNDWHTTPVPVLLKSEYKKRGEFKDTKTALCIHNIAFQVGDRWRASAAVGGVGPLASRVAGVPASGSRRCKGTTARAELRASPVMLLQGRFWRDSFGELSLPQEAASLFDFQVSQPGGMRGPGWVGGCGGGGAARAAGRQRSPTNAQLLADQLPACVPRRVLAGPSLTRASLPPPRGAHAGWLPQGVR